MMSKGLTVVVPVFNRHELLERALSSLVSQTCHNFSVIVVDDGSTEDLISIVKNFSNFLKIKYIKINNSGSPARPRNIGIDNATTEWIAFLDSDDWWSTNKIDEISKLLGKSFDVFYHKLIVKNINIDSNKNNKITVGTRLSSNPLNQILTSGNFVPNSSVVIRRDILKRIGSLSTNKPLIEDYDLMIRLAAYGARFKFIDKPLGFYWIGDDNISKASATNAIALSNVFNKNRHLIPRNLVSSAKSYENYSVGIAYLNAGHIEYALKNFISALLIASPNLKIRTTIRIVQILLLKSYRKVHSNK